MTADKPENVAGAGPAPSFIDRGRHRSGAFPKLFLDGEDAAQFLDSVKRLADASQSATSELQLSVRPTQDFILTQLRETDRKLGILIDDRVRLAVMERRLDRHESRTWIRILAMIILVLVTAGVTSFATAHLLLEGINAHGTYERAHEPR